MKTSWILMACMIVSASAFAEDWACCDIDCPEYRGGVDEEYCACYCDVYPDDPECRESCDSIKTEEGVYTEEMCRVGACPNTEDGKAQTCIPVSYRATSVSSDSSDGEFCTCCPQERIEACEAAGGEIGWRTPDSTCMCFNYRCGNYPDYFIYEDRTSDQMCSGFCLNDGDFCVAFSNEKCGCCPLDKITECENKGGTLDGNCNCCFSTCPDKEGYTVTLNSDGTCQYSKQKICTAKTASDGTIIPGTEVCQ